MQLTVNGNSSTENGKSASSIGTGDAQGVGRLTFLLMSDLQPEEESSQGKKAQPPAPQFAWVPLLSNILQWLASRRPSPPFHKSRLLLLIRDVLYCRQQASIFLLLQPSQKRKEENRQWLEIFRQITSLGRSSGSDSAGDASQSLHSNSNSEPTSGKKSLAVSTPIRRRTIATAATNVQKALQSKSTDSLPLSHSHSNLNSSSSSAVKRRSNSFIASLTPGAAGGANSASQSVRKTTLGNIFSQVENQNADGEGYMEDFRRSEVIIYKWL